MESNTQIRIYVDDNVLWLTGDNIIPAGFRAAPAGQSLLETVRKMRGKNSGNIAYTITSLKDTWKDLEQSFKIVEAAGGVVSNPEGETLFIFRHGKWDLPKGKMEKGESYEECAVREVEEECGIHVHRLGNPLTTTYHTYLHKGREVLKRTAWFSMSCRDKEKPSPQEEEDITEVAWLSNAEIKRKVLNNTYHSIADLVTEVIKL
jgi:8-oxo-dGTP pyrophosphatase MutT (NUDIX family)